MPLLLQLDLKTLPRKCGFPLEEGLLGVFACTAPPDCDLGFPFSESATVLLYPRAPAPQVAQAPNQLRKVVIAGWLPFDDLPDPYEHQFLGLAYDYPAPNQVAVDCDDPKLSVLIDDQTEDLAESIATAARRDKLGGWAKTFQGPAYLQCPECATLMRLLFQLDSSDNLPHMFGDGGTAHVLYCPNHPRVLAYCWQSS